MRSISDWSDLINLAVARVTIHGRRRDEIESAFASALGPNPEPEDLDIYFTSVGAGWNRFFLASMVGGVALTLIVRLVAPGSGDVRAFALALFPVVICLVGEADAEWRYYLAKRATRPRTDPRKIAGLTRAARAANFGIVLQLLAGLTASTLGWFLF